MRTDSNFRSGEDGMVVAADGGRSVGRVFDRDRYGRPPPETSVRFAGLPEQGALDESDLATVHR